MSISGRTYHRTKPPAGAQASGGHPSLNGIRENLTFSEGGGIPRNTNSAFQPTFTGTPTWVRDSGGMGISVAGSQSIDIPNSGNLAAGDFTVRVRHKPTSFTNTTYNALFAKVGGGASELEFYIDNSGNVSYGRVGNASSGFSAATGMIIGKVSDFVVTRAGANTNVYIDGKIIATDIGSFTATLGATGGVMSLGRDLAGGGNDYVGTYYSLQTATRAWSAAEIAAMYASPYGAYVMRPSGAASRVVAVAMRSPLTTLLVG